MKEREWRRFPARWEESRRSPSSCRTSWGRRWRCLPATSLIAFLCSRMARLISAPSPSPLTQELAIWLREGLVRLGPTFIKIGQQFSTRVDVLSPEFIKELEKLQVAAGGDVGM